MLEHAGPEAGIKPEVLKKEIGRFTQKLSSYKMLMAAGIPIGAGSDVGVLRVVLSGWEDRIGTVEEGNIADLVVLSGNPLENIINLRNVEMVITNGQRIAFKT